MSVKLNHLNLTVTDVPAAKQFLETYFDLRPAEEGPSNKNFVILFDDNGLVLSLMKATHNTEVRYPGNFHIGFIQENEARVNELNARMKADGYDVEPPERHHAWTFYILAPGGFTVEVLA
jgi:lactoylglutathione lyase